MTTTLERPTVDKAPAKRGGRMQKLGIVLLIGGLLFMIGGGVAFSMTQDGYETLQAFSETQGVELSYNDDGQLVDRGTTEEADKTMDLLVGEWKYPVVESDLDPNDPLINTATEYMYQMATITKHVLNGTQTVVLTEDAEYNGEVYPAGTYEFAVDGRYWEGFDRQNPIEGPARSQTWTGTVFGLNANLGVGTVTHSALQLALAMAGILAGLGAMFIVTGAGLIWVSKES